MARGVTDVDLKNKNAQFITPKIFAEKTAAADKVVHPHRALLRSIAYRMLGSVADAEDMLRPEM